MTKPPVFWTARFQFGITLRTRAAADIPPLLAFCRARELGRNPRRILHVLHGRNADIVLAHPGGKPSYLYQSVPAGNGVLAKDDRGFADALVCSCHGLRFGQEGVAVGYPNLSVTEVAQSTSYHGLIFASLDAAAAALSSYLGDFAWYLDMLLDRREGGVEIIGGAAFRWVVEANWKVAAEAFAGDAYCDLTLHAATHAAMRYRPPSTANQGLQISAGAGALSLLTETALYTPSVVVAEYERSIAAETEGRLGEDRARNLVPLVGTLFPNLSFDWRSRSLHVWQPRGPARTEINTYCFADRQAPESVKEELRKSCQLHFGPAGMRAQDQVGPWKSLTERSSGLLAGRLPLNLQMGLGHEVKRNLPGRISELFSEMNQRSFFSWWEDRLDEPVEAPLVADTMRIAPPRGDST